MTSRQIRRDSESSDLGAWMPRERGRLKTFMTRELDHMDVIRALEPSANGFGYFPRKESTSQRGRDGPHIESCEAVGK